MIRFSGVKDISCGTKFNQKLFRENRVVPYGQRNMKKLPVAFRNLANTNKTPTPAVH
jgi:hypothetical protein